MASASTSIGKELQVRSRDSATDSLNTATVNPQRSHSSKVAGGMPLRRSGHENLSPVRVVDGQKAAQSVA